MRSYDCALRGSNPVSNKPGMLGTVAGVALGCAFPAAIPFMLGAVGVGLVVAKKKIEYHEDQIAQSYAREARRGR